MTPPAILHASSSDTSTQSASRENAGVQGNVFYATLLRALAEALRLPLGALVVEQLDERSNPAARSPALAGMSAAASGGSVPGGTILNPVTKTERHLGLTGTDQYKHTWRADGAPGAVAESDRTFDRSPERLLAGETHARRSVPREEGKGQEELAEHPLVIRLLILTVLPPSGSKAVQETEKAPSEGQRSGPQKRSLQSLSRVRRRAAEIMDDVLSLQGRVLR